MLAAIFKDRRHDRQRRKRKVNKKLKKQKMSILDTEQIKDFSFNLPPEAFESLRTELKLFGERASKVLEIDLNKRLEKHNKEEILNILLEKSKIYKKVLSDNYEVFKTKNISLESIRKKNREAFWEYMNSFISEFVGNLEDIKSYLLKKPITETLASHFKELGYILNCEMICEDWFPHHLLSVFRLIEREKKSERLFGLDLEYTLEHIETLKECAIFPLSFFNSSKSLIRIDRSTALTALTMKDIGDVRIEYERNLIKSLCSTNYSDLVFKYIFLHEKSHLVFDKIFNEFPFPPENLNNPKFRDKPDILSETWARLITLFLSEGVLAYECYIISELKNSEYPIYNKTHECLMELCPELFKINVPSFEEFVKKIRICSLLGLKRIVEWMKNNFGHGPINSWMSLIENIENAYSEVLYSVPQLTEIYRPKLDEKCKLIKGEWGQKTEDHLDRMGSANYNLLYNQDLFFYTNHT